ncbi:hypothetical protein K7432_000412 [Basidiobolus ranarum]|uniref:Uncharacterized protein n=1 Tax=Basidiobolus ranarum TaxID=34480 RepID=A0ABR2X547_9FUNG
MDYFFDFMLMENLLGSCNRKLRKYNRSKKREQHLRNRLLLINFRKAAKREIAAHNDDEDIEFVEVPIPSPEPHSQQSCDVITDTKQGKELCPSAYSGNGVEFESSCQPLIAHEQSSSYEYTEPTSCHPSETGKRCRQGVWNEEDSIQSEKRARLCF